MNFLFKMIDDSILYRINVEFSKSRKKYILRVRDFENTFGVVEVLTCIDAWDVMNFFFRIFGFGISFGDSPYSPVEAIEDTGVEGKPTVPKIDTSLPSSASPFYPEESRILKLANSLWKLVPSTSVMHG